MLLAIDTSTSQIGLALLDESHLIAESIWQSHQHHTVELAPALSELLRRTGVKMIDIQSLAVALGPGSFTSLRAGLAFIKGLALARHLPLIGISTLDVLAAAQPLSRLPLAASLAIGRSRIALGWYKSGKTEWKPDGAPKITTVVSLASSIDKPTHVAGEFNAEERARLARKKINVVLAPLSRCVRRPGVLAELAWVRWRDGKVDEPASLAPIYLHSGEPISV